MLTRLEVCLVYCYHCEWSRNHSTTVEELVVLKVAWVGWKISIFVSPCMGGSKKPHTLRKQDSALPGNHALNKCQECFKLVWSVLNWVWILQLTQHNLTWTVQNTWNKTIWHWIYAEVVRQRNRSRLIVYTPYSTQSRHMEIPFEHFCCDYSFLRCAQGTPMLELHATLFNVWLS